MRPLLALTALLLLISAYPTPAWAGHGAVRFEHLSLAEGLPEAGVLSILQDHLGFLWLGTLNGLVRWDGTTFVTYRPDPEDPHSIGGRIVLSLFEDAAGDLWVGTRRGGLDRYDRAHDRFVRYRPDPEDPGALGFEAVSSLLAAPDGGLWVGLGDMESEERGRGLDLFDPATETFRHFRHDPDDPTSLGHDTVVALAGSGDGTVWVGTLGGGLDRLDPATGRFGHYRADPRDPSALASDLITRLALAPDGAVWVATAGGGLHRLDPDTGRFRRYEARPEDSGALDSGNVYALSVGRSGEIWAGTWGGGLHRLADPTDPDARWVRYEHDPSRPDSLSPSAGIASIYEDRTGILWIGSWDAGLDQLDPHALKFPALRHDPEDPDSLASDRTSALLEDGEGRLWVGTLDAGLDRYDPETERFSHFRHDDEDPSSLGADRILCLLLDRKGRVWIGTGGGGLYRFRPESSDFERIQRGPFRGRASRDDWVFSLLEDRDGILWFGTGNGGLNRLDPESGSWSRFYPQGEDADTLGRHLIRDLLQDSEGLLWLATDAGLLRFDPETGDFTTYLDPLTGLDMLYALHEDRAGRLWVATFNGGLHLFDREEGRSRALTEREGLAHDTVYGILEDDEGELWLSTGNGISRFDPEEESFRNYGPADGLLGHRFDGGAVRTRRGELIFGGTHGLHAFFPDRIQDNPYPPQVALTELRVFYQPVAPGPGAPLSEDVSVADQVVLTHRENVISFGFAALHFSDPERNRYAFRLDPVDSGWNEVGHQRTATFTNLAPGDYIFRVRAANPDGVWNEEGTSIRLRILPPWWATWWAYTLYGVLFVATLVAADRFQRVRVVGRERARARAEQVELRAEAAELQAKAAEAQARALQAENDRRGRELEEARSLQLSLLPERIPAVSGFEIAASMHTATEVGGDYYDFDVGPDGTLTVAIGDATGHGMRAGTVVTATKALFCLLASEEDSLEILRRSSVVLRRMQLQNLFMALSLVRLRADRIEVAGAGMPPVLIRRAATGKVEELHLEGAPLGSFVDFPYSTAAAVLEVGDAVVLMSDGLPEMLDPCGDVLGYDRLAELLGELDDLAPEAVIRHLEGAAREWAGGCAQEDDLTLVVLRRRAE